MDNKDKIKLRHVYFGDCLYPKDFIPIGIATVRHCPLISKFENLNVDEQAATFNAIVDWLVTNYPDEFRVE